MGKRISSQYPKGNRKEIDSLKASLLDLKKRFDEIEKSQNFILKKYDTVVSTIKDVKEHNEGVKSQIKEIKEDINKLGNERFNVEVKLDELEQYARRDCLEITGIPVVPNDSPALLVKEMSEIMGVNLNENDISIAHRLPPTKKVKDRLIVKFSRREKRDEIYSKRKNLKFHSLTWSPEGGQPLDLSTASYQPSVQQI